MADLTKLASKKNADEGVWFQVELYDEPQDFDIKIYGNDSDAVQEYEKEKVRSLKLNKKGNKIDADAIEKLVETIDDDILIRIGGLRSRDNEPLILLDKELKDDKESYQFLIDNIPAIKEFILEKARERTNFLSSGKKN